MEVKAVKISELRPHPKNPRVHPDSAIEKLERSIKEYGWTNPVLVSADGYILAGHARLKAAEKAGISEVPVIYLPLEGAKAEAYLIADNRLQDETDWDYEKLKDLLQDLDTGELDLELTGFDGEELDRLLGDVGGVINEQPPTLTERFVVPPFSVLDARQGYWQERKSAWLGLGICSELGRGEGLAYDLPNWAARGRKVSPGGSLRPACDYSNKERGDGRGRPLKTTKDGKMYAGGAGPAVNRVSPMPDYITGKDGLSVNIGTSIFDPVLCEIAYRWFCPADGHVIDPFAGGSVRGIVAGRLGRHYTGVELRAEQVKANQEQAYIAGDNSPKWIIGNSADIRRLAPGAYDFIFSCPPYYDLEIYSNMDGELSNCSTYEEFLIQYKFIVKETVALLKNNRFACFVVGDMRDKRGNYRNFPAHTIEAFIEAGMELYNEAILVTAVGSLPIRVVRPFERSRKLGKTHQNVLVFIKGDSKVAAEICGDIGIDDAALKEVV